MPSTLLASNMCSMTSQGHSRDPHRDLARGNLPAAWAALELKSISLAGALLVAERQPHRLERVTARWFGLYCAEEQPDLDEAQAVAALLRALPSAGRAPALRALE